LQKTPWDLRSYELEGAAWANRKVKRKENMAREQDHAADVGLTGLLFDVTIYIYVGIVLEK